MENLSVNPENYKILVVDDIATNVLLLKTILGKAGYRIVTATGGREALEKVESESPDLILLDIMMPDMNGYEVIERLKADERFCRIPVIFLSALHDSENIVKGFKMGASDYVSKPFNHEELITRVAHHMFIAEAQRVIVRQNEELQETLASRDKMYSVIAHDLRSPIGSLKMLFNTLLDSLDAERVGAGNLDMLRMGNDIAEDTFRCSTTCSSGRSVRPGGCIRCIRMSIWPKSYSFPRKFRSRWPGPKELSSNTTFPRRFTCGAMSIWSRRSSATC